MNVFQGLENKNMPTCHDSREDHVTKLRVASKVSQHCSYKIFSILCCGGIRMGIEDIFGFTLYQNTHTLVIN